MRDKQRRRRLEEALDRLAEERGPLYARRIALIVWPNFSRGRVDYALEAERVANEEEYVRLVSKGYDTHHPYVEEVQQEKADETWLLLYELLQRWAFNIFLRWTPETPRREMLESTVACASLAGGEIVNSHFPYDTEFRRWAYVILQNVIRNYIGDRANAKTVPPHEEVPVDAYVGWLENLRDPQSMSDRNRREWAEVLMQGIARLAPDYQEFIILYYIDGLSFSQLSEKLGVSVDTLYVRHFRALKKLGKILREMGHIYE